MTTTALNSRFPFETLDEINRHRPTGPARDQWNADVIAALCGSADVDGHVRNALNSAMALADRHVRADMETAIHNAAERTHDENPLIVAQELGARLGHPVDVTLLVELAEAMDRIVSGEDAIAISDAYGRRDDLPAAILRGLVNG